MPTYEHPRQLFSVEHPSEWEPHFQEESNSVTFVYSGRVDPTAVSFSPVVMGADESQPGDEELRMQLVKTAHRLDIPLAPEEVTLLRQGERTVAYGEGESARADLAPSGTRIRMWLVRAGSLALYATQLGPGAASESQRRAADELLASLRLPEVQPPSPEQFRERVLEVLQREYPRFQATAGDAWTIELSDTEGELNTSLGLENLYRSCLLTPESAGVLIREHLDQMLTAELEHDEYHDYAAVRGRLLPMLKSHDWVREIRRELPLVSVEFAPGLLLCFAIDSPTRLAYATETILDEWGVPLERVQEVAVDNLAERSGELPVTVLPARDGGTIAMVVNTQDGYDAARLVLPGLRDSFAAELGDEYLVGLPNRDFLIAFSERDPEVCASIIRQVKQDFQRMNHPLTPYIFRVRDDVLERTDL
ncbi:MAG: DUF1444 family protein [Armatimonadota bacterium]